MRRALVLVLLFGSSVQADTPAPDALAVLRDATQRWTYELVAGPSVDKLAAIPKGPTVTCGVTGVTATESRIVCETTAKSPLVALVLGPRTLVFDDVGVRELRGDATPEARADKANAMALTFPKALAVDGVVDVKSKDGASARILTRIDTIVVQGTKRTVWVSNVTTTEATRGTSSRVVHTAAVFAPGVGPVQMCKQQDAAQPAVVCLRLVERAAPDRLTPTPPTPQITVARKVARIKTSLTADKLAAKVFAAYMPGIRRCYVDVLAAKPTASGVLSYVLTVNAVGKTQDVLVKSFDASLTACARKLAANWRFSIPLSEYAEPIAARYELDLRLSSQKTP